MMDRVCLYTPPLSSVASYFEMVDLAAEYGITQLETINALELAMPDTVFAQELKAYADTKGISFPCVSLGIDLVGENRQTAVETAKAYVDVAAILKAPYFHHTIAFDFRHPKKVLSNAALYYEQGLDAVRSIYDYANTYGIRTVFEDQGFLFNGCETFSRFLADVERDVGIIADFGNIAFVDETIEPFIWRFADRIVHTHVKDYRITAQAQRQMRPGEYLTMNGSYLQDCPLGQGDIPIKKAMRLLGELQYSGSISLESPPFGANERDAFEKNLHRMQTYIQNFL